MEGVCPKCGIDKSLLVYHKWPQQWYHEIGPVINLCHDCIIQLDNAYPLLVFLTAEQCEERIQNFLQTF